MRHLTIRAGYLAVIILVLLFFLLGQSGSSSLSLPDLARAGANMFTQVSYLQVTLICLLTPVFMAGAIAQEANPRTWDILLTTPLNNLQIVLGNLFGRLFFVVALLFSSLPLFVMTQYFGGVPGEAIFASYAIAVFSALVVASIAITLSVTRTAGRRAVVVFYFSVIMYLFVTGGADAIFSSPVENSAVARHTTAFTPLNPFLALRVLLDSNAYVPHDFTGTDAAGFVRLWMGRPIAAFCWTAGLVSLLLTAFSTIRVRIIGTKAGGNPWLRRLFGLAARGATERPARTVGVNPVAWRESVARGRTLGTMLARWGFVSAGILLGIVLLVLYHVGTLDHAGLRLALGTVVMGEVAIIALAALNMSSTAVSREREDGSLDIILTTPIQPGPYLAGKLRGLLQYLGPLMLVPTTTLLLFAIYVLAGGFGRNGGITVTETAAALANNAPELPVILPEAALAVPILLVPFTGFCVMIGLQWSIRSRGTISSMIAAVGVVLAIGGVLTLCGRIGGHGMSIVGAVLSAFSPVNLVLAHIAPGAWIPSALEAGPAAARSTLFISALIAAGAYAGVSVGLHSAMKRSFMMTVRRLSGTR